MQVSNFLEYYTVIYTALRANLPSRPIYLTLHFITIGSFFFVLEAETFNEYAELAFSSTSAITFAAFYFIITFNRDNFMELIGQLQEIIDKSKSDFMIKHKFLIDRNLYFLFSRN